MKQFDEQKSDTYVYNQTLALTVQITIDSFSSAQYWAHLISQGFLH